MTTRWRLAAIIYVILNIGGAGYAASMGEGMHATLHVAFLALGGAAYAIWRLSRPRAVQQQALAGQIDPRLDYLQQSVDAIALEVERIGEAQRFNEKLRAQREQKPGSGTEQT